LGQILLPLSAFDRSVNGDRVLALPRPACWRISSGRSRNHVCQNACFSIRSSSEAKSTMDATNRKCERISCKEPEISNSFQGFRVKRRLARARCQSTAMGSALSPPASIGPRHGLVQASEIPLSPLGIQDRASFSLTVLISARSLSDTGKRDFFRCGGQTQTISPLDVTRVIGMQLTYCVGVAAELLADVKAQPVRSVQQAERSGQESPRRAGNHSEAAALAAFPVSSLGLPTFGSH
jgi:hypothetical protein